MTVFDFWIFNRSHHASVASIQCGSSFCDSRYGNLLYYEQWHRSVQLDAEVQEVKLMHGLIYMLKQFSQKISPRP